MILNPDEKIKELHNLLNSFEKCYPIIKKYIKKYKISEQKEKCYLSWFAGQIYFSSESDLSKDIFMDYFFQKIFDTFSMKTVNEKSGLFAFFSLGAVVSINKFDQIKTILNDYYSIIAAGIVLIQRFKFDYIENGIKKWSIETIEKYSNIERNNPTEEIGSIKEFNKIINSKDEEKDDIKILN